MKRLVVVLIAVILLVGCAPSWEDVFEIRIIKQNVVFDGYLNGEYENYLEEYDYDLYEITNTTSKTLHDVYVVIFVNNGDVISSDYKDFEYKDYIGSILPGETIEYKLTNSDIQEAAKEHNTGLKFISTEIKRIEFK